MKSSGAGEDRGDPAEETAVWWMGLPSLAALL